MEKIKWYFPKTVDEATGILEKKKNVVLHAGGTSLVLQGVRSRKGFVHLGKLPFSYFNASNGTIEIGATQTYEDVMENVRKVDPKSILSDAMEYLPPPLRNRITVGGSVSLFPAWSNIMGPLLALDAEVILVGKNAGTYNVAEFASTSSLKEKSIVQGVRFKLSGHDGHFYRAQRTCFDYSCFTLSILIKKKADGTIEDAKIVVIGCKEKFKRIKDVEEKLLNKNLGAIDIEGVTKDIDLEFHPKKLGSPEYLKHLARVELGRGLQTFTQARSN